MEFLVTVNTSTTNFSNKELQKATNAVFKLGDAIKKNWFEIAHIVANVDKLECYKDDGFNNVHEWVEKTFGIKKTASYSLLTIGKEYIREIVNASGKVIGYGTNLVSDNTKDFSKTQVERMLPAGHELATELVNDGEITPEMSAKTISKIVKSYTKQEDLEKEESTQEVEKEESTQEDVEKEEFTTTTECITVFDADGNIYLVPTDILQKYLVK